MRKPGSDQGFTLIELMTVVAIVVTLGLIAAPRMNLYALQGRLQAAKPYLMELAAKERMYFIETGRYCCTAYDGSSEDILVSSLGVTLADTGDFCFIFVCQSSSLCEKPSSSPSWIVQQQGTAPDFEVWALLRSAGGGVTGPGSTNCNPAQNKVSPQGWVNPNNATTLPGRAGEVVALRYPPPTNGQSSSVGTYHAIYFDWRDGFTSSDAMYP